MQFDATDMASYDDVGTIEKSAYVMEAGEYKIFVGKNVRDAQEIDYKYTLAENRICQKLTEYYTPENLGRRLTASGEYIEVPDRTYSRKTFECTYECPEKIPAPEDRKMLPEVAKGNISLCC